MEFLWNFVLLPKKMTTDIGGVTEYTEHGRVGLLLNETKWHLVSFSLVLNETKCHLVLVLPN